MRYIDTDILLRYLTADDPGKAERTLALLRRIELGEEKAVTSHLVIFEAIFTMQRSYRLSKAQVRDKILPIVDLRGLQLPDKYLFRQALDLFVERNIPFTDAFNVVSMRSKGLDEIYSWDHHYDRVPGIRSVQPAELEEGQP